MLLSLRHIMRLRQCQCLHLAPQQPNQQRQQCSPLAATPPCCSNRRGLHLLTSVCRQPCVCAMCRQTWCTSSSRALVARMSPVYRIATVVFGHGCAVALVFRHRPCRQGCLCSHISAIPTMRLGLNSSFVCVGWPCSLRCNALIGPTDERPPPKVFVPSVHPPMSSSAAGSVSVRCLNAPALTQPSRTQACEPATQQVFLSPSGSPPASPACPAE